LLQNPYNITHLTLGTLIHYLAKLKSQILVDIQQTWIEMQMNCTLTSPLLIPLCV